MLSMLGLTDDYVPDGRAISQIMDPSDMPAGIAGDASRYDALSNAYKQLEAPFGEFGRDSLQVSTRAVSTTSPNDSTHKRWESQLAACEAVRTPVVSKIDALLSDAAFEPTFKINQSQAASLTEQANELITDMSELDGMATPPHSRICIAGGGSDATRVHKDPMGRRVRKARKGYPALTPRRRGSGSPQPSVAMPGSP